jgi:flagellar secretion chaperone FliS
MGFNNPYSAYRDTAVKTASQGKLVVLLYEGAIKQLLSAGDCFSADGKVPAQSIEKYGNYITRAQEIISELQVSLDMDKGGHISENLMALYVYFNQELVSANITKDKKKLDFVLNMMTQLKTAWETAATTTAGTPQSAITSALNITG